MKHNNNNNKLHFGATAQWTESLRNQEEITKK